MLIAGSVAMTLILAAGAASAGTTPHGAGGGKTNAGNHFDFSVFALPKGGHIAYVGTPPGTSTFVDLNICKNITSVIFNHTNTTQRPNVFVQATCTDKRTGFVYVVEVTYVDNGEPGGMVDKACYYFSDSHDSFLFKDCSGQGGLIQNGNVQIVHS
jgi:hypothetical protein